MDIFSGIAIALYVGHHIGDYWVQRDADAACKGKAGREGVRACLNHVASYVLTQYVCAMLVLAVTEPDGFVPIMFGLLLAMVVSGVFHYAADRREYGIMFRLARMVPGKAKFLTLGVPRAGVSIELWDDCETCDGRGTGGAASGPETNGRCADCRGGGKLPHTVGDNPSLGTGAWALDQSWHIATSVFLPALIVALFA